MTRNYSKDVRIFNPHKDLESIVQLYQANHEEVRNFLRSHNVNNDLQGVRNEKVYELIAEKLGYPIPC